MPSRATLLTITLASLVLLLTAAAAAQPAAPPAPPTPAQPASPALPSSPALEAQLAEARRRLAEAAREVAQLSTQLSGPLIEQLMPYTGRALIGVQLEGNSAPGGARVREVSPGGPAADAGIKPGDVIVAVNGTAVTGEDPVEQVTHMMREVKPDSRVNVRVLREGKPHDFVLTARQRPSVLVRAHGMPDIELPGLPELSALPELRGDFMFRRPLRDMELATLTPQLGSYFGSDHGVLVVRAPADGALRLEDGDVILAIDGREPASGSHATRILGSYQPGEKIALRILRQHKRLDIDTTLPGEASSRQQLREHAAAPERSAAPIRPVIYGSDSA